MANSNSPSRPTFNDPNIFHGHTKFSPTDCTGEMSKEAAVRFLLAENISCLNKINLSIASASGSERKRSK